MEIFLNLCNEIEAPTRSDWRPISQDIKRRYEGLIEEDMLAHSQRAMSQFEAERGSDDEKFLNLCSLVAAFYFVPEILVPKNERAELSPTEIRPRLDKGRKLLERVLKRGLDNETVKKLLDANSFDEYLPSGQDPVDGVLETLILQVTMKTFLAYACGVLSQYYNLRSRYAFGIALLEMFGDFAASKNFLELSNYINALIQTGWVIMNEVRYHTTLTAKLVMISTTLVI